MWGSRRDRNKFYEQLFRDGVRFCDRKYFWYSSTEQRSNSMDIVNESILYIDRKIKEKGFGNDGFESELHIRCWFFLHLKSCFIKNIKQWGKCTSLSTPVGEDGMTIEDFIASRIEHPLLDEENVITDINRAIASLPKDQQFYIQQVWVEGKSITELQGNTKYIKRSLDAAKLKLMRSLVTRKH